METFVARQPVFDRQQRVAGCELLFRQCRADLLAAGNGKKGLVKNGTEG